MKQSRNQAAALNVVTQLISSNAQAELSKITNLPSVRRDLLAISNPANSYSDIFSRAVIQSKTWYDPNPVGTDYIFREFIDSITTGKVSSGEARTILNQKLGLLLSGSSLNSISGAGN